MMPATAHAEPAEACTNTESSSTHESLRVNREIKASSCGLLSKDQITAFHRDGFVWGGPVLKDNELSDMLDHLDLVLQEKSAAKPAAKRNLLGDGSEQVVIQVVNIWQADPLFRRMLAVPAICEAVASLMETDTVRVWHDQIQLKPAKVGGPTTWHQDHPYWPVVQPADLISAWIALEDADVENGCMWMVPGSHLWGAHKSGTIGTDYETFAPLPDLSLLPPGTDVNPVACPVKAGEVMFHHCLTWHGSPGNPSDRRRPAWAIHYMPGWTRYEPSGEHMVASHIEVEKGEVLQGKDFPIVWNGGEPACLS